jgi:hypothetical protein
MAHRRIPGKVGALSGLAGKTDKRFCPARAISIAEKKKYEN